MLSYVFLSAARVRGLWFFLSGFSRWRHSCTDIVCVCFSLFPPRAFVFT